MKEQTKNLLPKRFSYGDALIGKLSKIKPGLPNRFTKLAIIFFFLILSLGYYPTFSIPPVKRNQAFAQNLEQKDEIIANSFSKPLILPHPGYLSTKFSIYHPAVDIAIGLGFPIHPILDGEITQVGRDIFGLGNFVEVLHERNFRSKYAHMGRIYVKAGDKISQENILGEVGMTGNTSGPHTHLEITQNGKFIDPLTILPGIDNMPYFAKR